MRTIVALGMSLGAVLASAAMAGAKTLTVEAGPNAQDRLQSALIDAKPGDVVAIGAGTFELTDGLSLDVNNVTVRGAGQDKTTLDFKGQKSAGEGLMITSNGDVIRDLTVLDAKGDAIKAKGSNGISFLYLTTAWSGPPKASNGAYGVYPVASTNVLIDHVTARGASDSGIYVGQSKNIVVQHSKAEFNVAGIEIENSYNADVHDNLATHNTGGILVFDLPNLPQQGGHSHRVFHNAVIDNDTPNFAPKGNIVAQVPNGTGIMVMANRDVHVFENRIDGNASAAVVLVGYKLAIKDANYNPLPRDIVIRDNQFGRNAWAPPMAAPGAKSPTPVLWDAATHFTRLGAPFDEAVNVVIKDGPVLKLNLPDSTSLAGMKPEVVASVQGTSVPMPPPVTLPPEQARLAQ